VFFKELKQTLQLADFLGHNTNAVRWQVWTTLLVYLLLRFCACLSQWGTVHQALCPSALGAVAKTGVVQPFGMLWDSRWRWPFSRHATAGLFAELRIIL
jgi:hypothetical protein